MRANYAALCHANYATLKIAYTPVQRAHRAESGQRPALRRWQIMHGDKALPGAVPLCGNTGLSSHVPVPLTSGWRDAAARRRGVCKQVRWAEAGTERASDPSMTMGVAMRNAVSGEGDSSDVVVGLCSVGVSEPWDPEPELAQLRRKVGPMVHAWISERMHKHRRKYSAPLCLVP